MILSRDDIPGGPRGSAGREPLGGRPLDLPVGTPRIEPLWPTGGGAPGHTAGCRSPRPEANFGGAIRQRIDHFRRINQLPADRPPFGRIEPVRNSV